MTASPSLPVHRTSDHEGSFGFAGGDTWFRVVGDLTGVPLVVLHGGPGYPSHYLEALQSLAAPGRAVIFYDQLASGRTTSGADPLQWTFDGFIAQLNALLEHLGVERVDILGHSWGGFLALELALRRPSFLRRLVLSSTAPSSSAFVASATALMRSLPQTVRETIELCEGAGDYDSAEYREAVGVFNDRFLNRMNPLPEAIRRSDAAMNAEMYRRLWGPSEFTCIGSLRSWSVADRLPQIDVPVLLTSGRYDEAGPRAQQLMLDRIPDVRWHCFENSAHQAHLSEHEEFVATVRAFLAH